MNAPRGTKITVRSGPTAARVALGLLWLAFALGIVGAIAAFALYFPESGIHITLSSVLLVSVPLLLVELSLVASVSALGRGRFLLAAGLTFLSSLLSAVMNVVEGLAVGASVTSGAALAWKLTQAVWTASFVLIVISLVACLVVIASRPTTRPV